MAGRTTHLSFIVLVRVTVLALTCAGSAEAQQPGDAVPPSALHGPTYPMSDPSITANPDTAPSADSRPPDNNRPRIWRKGDAVVQAYVQALQRALPSHGYRTGAATGQLDPLTEQSILAYQADADLPQNAHDARALKTTLDNVTYAHPAVMAGQPRRAPTVPLLPPEPQAPAAPAEPAASVPSPAAPDEAGIRHVQERLRAKGYDIEITSKLDIYTTNAIKLFQADNDLPKDGRVDGYLVDLLNR